MDYIIPSFLRSSARTEPLNFPEALQDIEATRRMKQMSELKEIKDRILTQQQELRKYEDFVNQSVNLKEQILRSDTEKLRFEKEQLQQTVKDERSKLAKYTEEQKKTLDAEVAIMKQYYEDEFEKLKQKARKDEFYTWNQDSGINPEESNFYLNLLKVAYPGESFSEDQDVETLALDAINFLDARTVFANSGYSESFLVRFLISAKGKSDEDIVEAIKDITERVPESFAVRYSNLLDGKTLAKRANNKMISNILIRIRPIGDNFMNINHDYFDFIVNINWNDHMDIFDEFFHIINDYSGFIIKGNLPKSVLDNRLKEFTPQNIILYPGLSNSMIKNNLNFFFKAFKIEGIESYRNIVSQNTGINIDHWNR